MAIQIVTHWVPKSGPQRGQQVPLQLYNKLVGPTGPIGICSKEGPTRKVQVWPQAVDFVQTCTGKVVERVWPFGGSGYAGSVELTESQFQQFVGAQMPVTQYERLAAVQTDQSVKAQTLQRLNAALDAGQITAAQFAQAIAACV